MTDGVMVNRGSSARTACEPAQRVTRSLLGYGVVAGPFYVLVILVQAWIQPRLPLLSRLASSRARLKPGRIQAWTRITRT